MADILFSFVPRTRAKFFSPWVFLLGPLFLTVAFYQISTEETAAMLFIIDVAIWLFCLLLILFLRWVSNTATRNNIIQIDSDGVLAGSFGGWKIQTALATVRRLEMTKDRTLTKIWIEPRDGGRRRLIMAFFGEMSPDEKSRFQAIATKFETTCIIA